MKVSEVDTKVLAEYLRLDDPEEIEMKELGSRHENVCAGFSELMQGA